MAKRKTRRGNRTFTDPGGDVWDSKFEWLVYNGLRDLGHSVRRCDQRDAIPYHTQVKQGRCLECGDDKIVQERIYTPDLSVVERQPGDGGSADEGEAVYLLECKGYFPKERRSQLASLARERKDLSLRVMFTEERKLTSTLSNIEYVLKYMKWPAAAWNNGAYEWRYP